MPADHAFEPVLAHEALDCAARRDDALAPQLAVDAPGPVGLPGRVIEPPDMPDELFVVLLPGGLRPSAAGIERRDRQVQFPAYGLDPEVVAEVIDHRVGLVRGWSSSLAKNTEAAFRISFARRNSAASLRS